MFVPLQFRGSSVGVIEAFDRVGGPEFRVEDERMLLAAAASAATAVATAQTVERDRLRRSLKAAEEERRRWARELHDETLQGLGGLRVLLSSARRSQDLPALQAAVQTAVDQLGDEISNLRALITELRPAALDELGLAPALDALLDRARASHGVEIAGSIDLHAGARDARFDPEFETAVYRIVQESVNNAARHGEADRIDVDIHIRNGDCEISVRDNGKGFDPEAPVSGFGLAGMRERASLAGGRIEVSSTAGGTSIVVVLPSAMPARRIA